MKSKQKNSKRPKLLRISEEMKQWSAMLEHELLGWPGVSSRPMFGFMGVYRNGTIFAGLPRSRALLTPSSIIFKLDPMPAQLSSRAKEDPRIEFEQRAPGARWYSFALNSPDDLRDALWWLEQAYRKARNTAGSTTTHRVGTPRPFRK